MRFIPLLLAWAVLAPATAGQTVLYRSLTTWTHLGGTPDWTDDVVVSGSEFPKVDQLNSTKTLQYTTAAIQLVRGSYVLTFRVMKFKDNNGVAPFFTEAVVGGKRFTNETPAKRIQIPVDPKTGKLKKPRWVWTDPLTFYVGSASANVVFFLKNMDTKITKQNFYFDAVILGKVRSEKILDCQSMTLHCATTWGFPYTSRGVKEKTSPFGRVDHVNAANLWWFHWHSRPIVLQPGIYTANVRAMKDTNMQYATGIDLRTTVNNVKYRVTWDPDEQILGKWVLTTNLSFAVTQPNTTITLAFENIGGGPKQYYTLDYMMVRRGGYGYFGRGGLGSKGWVKLRGDVPKLGGTMRVEVRNIPSTVFLLFGRKKVDIDLTGMGLMMCRLYTMPLIVTPGVSSKNGKAVFTFPIPNNAALIGARWFNQALCVDPKANSAGLTTSNGAEAAIED